MKLWVKTSISVVCISWTQLSAAGKVPVIPGSSLGLSGITIPQNVISAPSPAAPAGPSTVLATPSITLPANVVTLIPQNEATNNNPGSSEIVVQPTTQQLISVLSTSTEITSFSVSQAQTAIGKISSILNNTDLNTAQTAQMIALRESFEMLISESNSF